MASSLAGTSGRGQRCASSSSISARVLWAAAASSSSAVSSVRCGASVTTALKCSRPSATAEKMAGNRRAARAAWMRLRAASSEKCSSCTQYRNIEGNPAGT